MSTRSRSSCETAQAVFAIDFRGLSVAQAGDLRAKLRDQNTKFQVVKNSLSERAADQAGVDALKPLLVGPTALAFVQGDAALVAKTLNDTARALRLLQFKGGLMNGTVLSAEDVISIARLPAREILNAQLVGTIAAPITGLVRGLNALIAGLAIALKQIADEGLVSGEAPAVAAASADVVAAASADVVAEASADVWPRVRLMRPRRRLRLMWWRRLRLTWWPRVRLTAAAGGGWCGAGGRCCRAGGVG